MENNAQWFARRLTQLRMQKDISARDMSLSLGQSESYINKIENGKALPSMTVFFYICDFLDITPQEFFAQDITAPQEFRRFTKECGRLTPQQLEHLMALIRDMRG